MTGRRVVVSRRPPALARDRAGTALGRVRDMAGPGACDSDVPAIVGRQLRQGLLTVGAVAGLLVGAPVAALWLPGPGAWVALTLALQAAWAGLAVYQLRRAERLER